MGMGTTDAWADQENMVYCLQSDAISSPFMLAPEENSRRAARIVPAIAAGQCAEPRGQP